MRFEAVVFDLDGVLVDSEIWWDEVRTDFATRNGRAWTRDDQAAVMGQNSRQWSRTMRERLGLDLDPETIEREVVDAVVARYRAEGPPLIAGAVEVVHRIARDLPIAVASSAHRAVIDASLEALGLASLFRAVVSSDEVPVGKPAPDVYLEAARQLGVRPERCLVVEDSLNGVKAARAAGMTVVLVPNASVPPAAGAHELASHVAPAIADVLAHLGLGPRRVLPGPAIAPHRRTLRYWLVGLLSTVLVSAYLRVRVQGRERLPDGPSIICFNHQCWLDPFILAAGIGLRPRLYFFGPREEDMSVGLRNRLMVWLGTAVPYKPSKSDLVSATKSVERILGAGGRLAIAGEGTIHVGERELLPLSNGPAFFAAHAGVPLVPVAINGTGWLAWGRTVRIVVCDPILPEGRANRATVEALTARVEASIRETVADFPDRPAPGPFGRRLTELFNEWPGGRRPEAPPRG